MSLPRRKSFAVSMILAVLAAVPPANTVYALDQAGVTEVVTSLQSLGSVVNGLAGFAGLGEPIPFTDVDPSEVLDLDSLLTDALGALGAPTSLAALATVLDGKDDPNLGGSGIAVQFNNVVGNDTANTLTFDFVATRTINVPLKFASGDVNLDGSTISLSFQLSVPFAFGYDGSANANEKVFLTNEPVIAVTASANIPAITPFESLLGFASVSVGGGLSLNVAINASFSDPDNNGRLTTDEWTSTALGDLVSVAFADGPGNDIDGSLTLDSTIIPGSPDASVIWVDASLFDGPGSPTVTLNSLDDFTNINPSTVFSGLASATTALLSAQQSGDLPLPFLKDGLNEVVKFADPLVQFIHELGDAAIVCGPNLTIPPTGSVFGLDAGDTVHCVAYTLNPVDLVDWKIDGVSANTNLSTVGPAPSVLVSLVLGTGGMDSVTLDFRLQGESTIRTGRPLFLTVDELTAKLSDIAGIDTVTPAYLSDQRILTYRLQHAIPTTTKVIDTDFGDQLKAQTGLFGLSHTGSADITVQASTSLDVTIGIILVEDPTDIKPGGTNADRFFIQVNPAGNEFQADVSIVAGSNFGIAGRLAFLEVAAGGVATAGNPGDAIFALLDSDDAGGAPSLAVNINAPGISVATLPAPIPNAILVADLISGGISGKISAQCELGFSAGLGVTASVSGDVLASGDVAVSWPDVFEDGGCTPNLAGISVTPSSNFNTDLLSFDIDPNNPQQMLSIILDAIAGFAQSIDGLPALGDLDVRVPIVGVSPRELLDKLEEINDVINAVRGAPADSVATLQALEETLEQELEIDPAALGFELGDIVAGGEKELILRLGYSKNASINKSLNIGLDDVGLELTSESQIQFDYSVDAQFDVIIPLKPASALADTRILETSRASVSGNLNLPVNLTAAVGPIEVTASGEAKLDIDVVVENPSTSPLSVSDWVSGVGVTLTGDSQDCGTDGVNDLLGQACARLDLDFAGPIGTLGFRVEDITTAPDDLTSYPAWYVSLPAGLGDAILNNLLDFSLLFKVLPELVAKLEGLLQDGAQDVKVPGLGNVLDAGADIVGTINDEVITPLANIAAAVTGTTAAEVETQIEDAILALGPIVQNRVGDPAVDAEDVDVVARCGGADCADLATVDQIDDVQVTFLIGQSVSTTPDFDIGIDGLRIGLSGALTGTVGWSLLVDVGLSKALGPYFDTDGRAEPELSLSAGVSIGNHPDGCGSNPADSDFFPQDDGYFDDYSNDECLKGTLAFLSVVMHDHDTSGTAITADTTLDLTSSATGGLLTAGNIINSIGLEPRIGVSANFDLAFRTAMDTGQDLLDGLPGVVGAFHLSWTFATDDLGGLGAPDVAFDNLYLDAGTFASVVLEPVVKEVRKITSPLEPIVDFVRAEVPVLTQLAEMVGEDPVTLLTLIELAGGDVELIETILAFIDLANNLPVDVGNVYIPLGNGGDAGSFALFGDKLLQGATTPDQAQSLISTSDAGSDLANSLPGNELRMRSGRPGTFGVEGLTFPFLDDAMQIFGMLLGQDVTIVRMDFGTFKASVSEGYEFGPIFLGPFPVTAEIGLSFTGEARFAMGYDTRGLRLLIDTGNPSKLFDGIFIDDLDINGVDVPEWKLTFRIMAEAALDVLIAEAGIYGGIDATLSGDLDDPNPDGKLYIEEIVDKLQNPFCLFIIRGALELFLGFYVEVDLFLWSDRWEWEIIRETLLDFTFGCDGEDPNLGDVVGGTLYLNIGSRAGNRGIQESEIDEEFSVRQIGDGKVSIEAFGLKQERSGVNKVVAQDAADGDDIIALIRGGDANPIYFTIESELNGGSGNDSLSGGDAVDRLNGGAGADKLLGGKGNDIINGDADDDRIDGGLGDDDLSGGSENDTVMGGPGSDIIDGDDGNDSLFGGPWTDVNPDGGDTISGGPGNDNIDGGDGNDTCYGDESGLDCLADGAAPGGTDSIRGGAGSDTLVGGNNNDQLTGNEDNDKLCGNGGNDILDGDDDSSTTADAGDRDASGGGGFAGGLFGGSGDDDMLGRGGDDEMFGGANNDEMFGGSGHDTMNGDAGEDQMNGEAGNDVMNGNAGDDTMNGGADGDTMSGNANNDQMFGDAGADQMFGNAGNDMMRGGGDVDTMQGNAGEDEMYGDSGNDLMYGNENNDTMRGNQDDDYMEGNDGADAMFGDSGHDDMIGGSNAAGAADGSDTMHGNAGTDVMLGDNGQLTRPAGGGPYLVPSFNGAIVRVVQLHDVGMVGSPSALSIQDFMFGDAEPDIMYGQGGPDEMHGGDSDDYMEGNDGADEMFGDAGNDDMVGGTGPVNGDSQTAGRDGYLDGADTMNGGDGFDVMAGDNAVLRRTQVAGLWTSNTFNGGIGHELRVLNDIDSSDVLVVSGADIMAGGNHDDWMYGQGQNDQMNGNAGDDLMEGNAGADAMNGDENQDDMIGGTVQAGVGDAGDQMHGNAGEDVMIGDNGTIGRPLTAGQWQTEALNTGAIVRTITLYDVQNTTNNISAAFSGGDTMDGDDDEDRMFGQGGPDTMHGNAGADYAEGNHGDDDIFGDDGEDDLIGGGSAIDGVISATSIGNGLLDGEDEMHGGEDGDVMAGDNARINRRLTAGGLWLVDPNVNDVLREIQLFDIERVAGAQVDERTSGSDQMFGDAGRDLMFGQGNTQTDPDGDGRFDEDVADGRDNDRDGREGASSTVFDCEDGEDNDADGLADAADPGCSARTDEDGGGDVMHGGDDVDCMEGNHGSDWMLGENGEDDMIGGSSSGNGLIGSGVPPTGLRDGHDVMSGGGDDDVMLADNGRIDRPTNAAGIWNKHLGFGFDLAARVIVMNQAADAAETFGGDFMLGNDDHDDMYGQQGNDYMEGNNGQDAMVGDLGRLTNTVETGSRQQVIATPSPFFQDTIYAAGTFTRSAQLFAFQNGLGAEGHDIILGGDGRDSLHGCAGNDIMNGDGDSVAGEDPVPATDDEDHAFGGDGNDVMWGGRSHDHLWGGYGDDYLDVRPRTASQVTAADSPEWFIYGEPDNFQGLDIIHGGWDRDAMQANVAAPGPPAADRLIDWVGGYNVFYVCPGAYGEGTITRAHSPHLRNFLLALAEADGALTPGVSGTSGFRELAYVFANEAPLNSHPPHPDHPGHFTCDDGLPRPATREKAISTRGDSPEGRPGSR